MKKYVMIMIIVMWKCQMKTKLKYYYGEKSLEFPAIIYADLERLLEKMLSCQDNPKKSYTEKKTKHTPSGYSLFANCSFDASKNKLDCYKRKDCMEKFCKDLKEYTMKIINYEKKRNDNINR